jgi:hypothetical protein
VGAALDEAYPEANEKWLYCTLPPAITADDRGGPNGALILTKDPDETGFNLKEHHGCDTQVIVPMMRRSRSSTHWIPKPGRTRQKQ